MGRNISCDSTRRKIILYCHEKGWSYRKIADHMRCSKAMVMNAIKHFKKYNTIENVPRKPMPRKTTLREDTAILMLAKNNPFIGSELIRSEVFGAEGSTGVSARTIRRRLREAKLNKTKSHAEEDSKDDSDEESESEPEKFVRCSRCNEVVTGFVFACVQCDVRECGACDARGRHAAHYVLRAPPGRHESEIERVVNKVREELSTFEHQLPTLDTKAQEVEVITEVKIEVDTEGDPLGSVDYSDSFTAAAAPTQVVPELVQVKSEPPDMSPTRQESPPVDSPATSRRPSAAVNTDVSQPPTKRRNVGPTSRATSITYPSHTPLTTHVLPLSNPNTAWFSSNSNADPKFASDPGIPPLPDSGPQTRIKEE